MEPRIKELEDLIIKEQDSISGDPNIIREYLLERRNLLDSEFSMVTTEAVNKLSLVITEVLKKYMDSIEKLRVILGDITLKYRISPLYDDSEVCMFPEDTVVITDSIESDPKELVDHAIWRMHYHGASWKDISEIKDYTWTFEVTGGEKRNDD